MLTPELVRLTINDNELTVRFTRLAVVPVVVMLEPNEPEPDTVDTAADSAADSTEHTLTLGHDCPAMAAWVSKQLGTGTMPVTVELWSAPNPLNGEVEYVVFDDVREVASEPDSGLRRGTLPRRLHYLTGTVQADPQVQTETGPLPTPTIVVDPVPAAVA